MGMIDICNVVFYCLYIIKPLGGCPILELEDHLTLLLTHFDAKRK